MRFIVAAILLVGMILTGCTRVETYTFKKERVDQAVAGNRGYLMGTPPPAPIVRETPKRTLIGIDMEIGILPGEKIELPPSEVRAPEEESVSIKTGVGKPATSLKEEEEWIK